MTAVKDRKNGTLTLSQCSAQEVLTVLLGLSQDKPEVIELLRQILSNQEKQMAFSAETLALLKKISDATDAAALRIQAKLDAALAKADVSDEDKAAITAALQSELDHLNALAADPAAPVPDAPAA